MSRSEVDVTPSIKMGGPDQVQKQRAARRLVGGPLGLSAAIDQHIGWNYNGVLTGLSFYVRDGIWHAVIKADIAGRPMVAFLNVGTFARCVEVCAEYAFRSWLIWKPDERPPRVRGRRRHR